MTCHRVNPWNFKVMRNAILKHENDRVQYFPLVLCHAVQGGPKF